MPRILTRRQFLRRSGHTLAAAGLASQAGWLTACRNSREPALDRLARELQGSVLRPGDAGYPAAHRLFKPEFDGIRPLAVARCESPRDVARAIAWAREAGVPLAARSGGHSYEGYSATEGLVIDVRKLARIDVDRDAGTATVGAGSTLFDVYTTLAGEGVGIPLGSCATIGIAGLTLGGGYGLSGRKHGLTLDRLREIEIVTADGRVRRCTADRGADLFWACRGGGGGNFGVATAFSFEVHHVRPVAVYELRWHWSDARAVIDAWQRHAPRAPDELVSFLELTGGPPAIRSGGQYLGPQRELEAAIEPLIAAAPPTVRRVRTMGFLDAQAMWAHVPARTRHPKVRRTTYKAKSDYVNEPLDDAGIDTVIRWIERWPNTAPVASSLVLDAHGGAINRVAPGATAFVHRDALFSAQYLVYWKPEDPREVVDRARAWLRGFHAAMRPHVSGFAYQNYIDAELAGWEQAYYGSNLARLVRVKRAYDPGNVFRFHQSIPLSG